MKRIFNILSLLILLTSCSDSKISEYEKIVSKTDRIMIEFENLEKSLELNKTEIESFKELLIRNVKPEIQRKYQNDINIELFHKDKIIGHYQINENSEYPFVNFNSDKVNFGFQLTYGIGMFLNEKK